MMLAGVTWDDMPKLDKYNKPDGNALCYNFVLGKCTGRYCTHKQGHAPAADIPNDFASSLCTMLKPGIDNMATKQAKKQRME